MKKIATISLSLALLLALALATGPAQADLAHYAVNWQVLAGGGQPAAANSVRLNGTFGQPVIGPAAGSTVNLGAGHWYSVRSGNKIYLPIVMRNQ